MNNGNSALLRRLELQGPLRADERQVIRDLEDDTKFLRKRAVIFDAQNDIDGLAVLKSGWAVSRIRSTRGQTAITQIYLPGDIIGFTEFGCRTTPHEIVMQTDGSVSLMDREVLPMIWERTPRLMSMLLSFSSLDEIVLRDRIYSITRMTAEERLIHFILTIKGRLSLTLDLMNDRFPLPLSQKEIGDVLGLTDIYVNRLLRAMMKNGELEVNRPYIRLLKQEEWVAKVNFRDRYSEMDQRWFKNCA